VASRGLCPVSLAYDVQRLAARRVHLLEERVANRPARQQHGEQREQRVSGMIGIRPAETGALASAAAAAGMSSRSTRSNPSWRAGALGQADRAFAALLRSDSPRASPAASQRSTRASVGAAPHADSNRFDRSDRPSSCAASAAPSNSRPRQSEWRTSRADATAARSGG
jgi:hypothetical protein